MAKDFIKILKLLKRKQKNLLSIFFFTLNWYGFRILGIGMLLPIMTAITKPENLMKLEIIDRTLKSTNINSMISL